MKSLRLKLSLYSLLLLTGWAYLLTINSCQINNGEITSKITEVEIKQFQNAWSQSIIGIGGAFNNDRDYKDLAKRHVQNFYGFDDGEVLVKPAFAKSKKFRTTSEGIISYLVGGNDNFPEDQGFALRVWKDIRWENAGIINGDGDVALAMGNYYLTDSLGEEQEFEFTIGFKKNKAKELKIVAHKAAQSD